MSLHLPDSLVVSNFLSMARGPDSEHYKEFEKNQDTGLDVTDLATLERLRALFLAAKEDDEGGYLQSLRSFTQAAVFDSAREQASELLHSG